MYRRFTVWVFCAVGLTCEMGHERLLEERRRAAGAAVAAGDDTSALRLYAEAITLAESIGETDPRLPVLLRELADVYLRKKMFLQAEPLLERELALSEANNRFLHPTLLPALERLVEALRAQNKDDELVAVLERIVAIQEAVNGDAEGPEVRAARSTLANAYLKLGKLQEATLLYEKTKEDEKLIQVQFLLAKEWIQAGRSEEALSLFEQAAKLAIDRLSPAHPLVGRLYQAAAEELLRKQKYNEAIARFELALQHQDKALRPNDPALADLLQTYARTLRQSVSDLHDGAVWLENGKTTTKRDRVNQALALEKRAVSIRPKKR